MRILQRKQLLNITILCSAILLIILLAAPLQLGFAAYINGRCIGVVRGHREAESVVHTVESELGEDAAPVTAALYLRLLADDYSDADTVLENARAASGITTEYVTEQLDIPFATEYVSDSTMYSGEEVKTADGQTGKKTLLVKVTKVNGEVRGEEIVSESVAAAPVAQVVAVGTRPQPTGIGTGAFVRPVSGTVTSTFGTRWGRQHTGVDFGCATGDAIAAADSGIVTFSGENGGYGNMIILDHQNGYETYYAHCSVLYAAVGTCVEQGEILAAGGNTGNSTGPHLHFEIRRDGTPLDPMNYL